MNISTIIPTRNEEQNLGRLLASLRACGAEEIVVADAGSADRTFEIARAGGARAMQVSGGLVAQLGAAAASTSGEVLLFLHADSELACDPYPPIRRALADSGVVAGGFRLSYGGQVRYRLLAAAANQRARLMGAPMGDQGIFIRRDVFERTGGFRSGPLLPDLALMRAARRHGRVALLPERLRSSPRRYEANGLLWNAVANQLLFIAHAVSGDRPPGWATRLLSRLRERRPEPVRSRGTAPTAT